MIARIRSRAAVLMAGAALLWAAPVLAQNNPECLGTQCGAPKEEGGGCGCGCGCSVFVAYTDDGKTLSFTDDRDGDGKSDGNDNCPFAANRDQADGDGDGMGDACDNCNRSIQLSPRWTPTAMAKVTPATAMTTATASPTRPTIAPRFQTPASRTWITMGKVTCATSDDDGDGIPDGSDDCPGFRA